MCYSTKKNFIAPELNTPMFIHIDVWVWRTGLEDHGIKWKLLPQRQCGTGEQLPSFFFGCICVVTRNVLPTLAIRVYCLRPLDQMWPASVWLFDKSGFISSNGSVLHNYLFSCKECLVTPILSISRWRTGITNASVPLTSLLLHVLGHSSFSSQTEEARATIGWFSCWHVSHIRIKEFMLNGIAPRLRWLCLQKKNPNR
jgi:hypothetical protein